MLGIHSYNILSNSYYYLKYMYIPYTMPKRTEYIVSMYKDNHELRKLSLDLVRYVTELPDVTEDRAKDFEFNPIYFYTQLTNFDEERRGVSSIRETFNMNAI